MPLKPWVSELGKMINTRLLCFGQRSKGSLAS